MPVYRAERRVRHPAADMFALVRDVESYPAFVPFCVGTRVRRREALGEGVDRVVAEMDVGYKAIRETFTTRATFDAPALKINVAYVDGPFSRLENRWSFRDLDAEGGAPGGGAPACLVEFYISYEFKSRVLALLLGSMFETIFKRFAGAFEARADEIYGKRGVS